MDLGTTMGGQNPYAGQDTGFGDFAKNVNLRDMLSGLINKPQPTGSIGAVDPTQVAQMGQAPIAPNFNVPQQAPPQQFSPQQMSMMTSPLLRRR